MLNLKLRNFIGKLYFPEIIIILIFLLIPLLQGCENEPTDLGLNYISPYDTLKTKVLDSRTDSILITSSNFQKYVNCFSSTNLLVGKFQNYESRGLIRFNNIPTGYDSAIILSAKLNFRYNKYYFQDSMGITSFNIYKLNNNFDFTQVTYDKITSADIGTTVLASFNGPTVDTTVSINFNFQTISDWLKYAVDTNYANKNYGIIFLPNMNSTTIKAFYSSNNSDFKPTITTIVKRNSDTITLTFNPSYSVSLSDVSSLVIPQGRMVLQSGISYYGSLKFDLSKLPSNVIINEAYMEFKLDKANSYNFSNSDKRITAAMISDSTLQNTDNINYTASLIDSITYSIRITPIMQKWSSGTAVNYGVQLKAITDLVNLDKFVLYSPESSDVTKRPYLRIIYTIRN